MEPPSCGGRSPRDAAIAGGGALLMSLDEVPVSSGGASADSRTGRSAGASTVVAETGRSGASAALSSGAGPSRYGLSSPASSVAGPVYGFVPRPRRGGRRRSFMQLVSVRVNARWLRAARQYCTCGGTIAPSRQGGATWEAGGKCRADHEMIVCLMRRDSVLCCTSASAELTRGGRTMILLGCGPSSRHVPLGSAGHWDCRWSSLDRSDATRGRTVGRIEYRFRA